MRFRNANRNQILKNNVPPSKGKRRNRRHLRSNKSFFARFSKFSVHSVLASVLLVLFVMYGPFTQFRDWYITTAMTTMNHQFLATWFYSQETIAEVQNRNKMIEIDSLTNPDLITTTVTQTASTPKITYQNEFEQAVLERDEKHPDYKIIKIKESAYTGYLAVIYDPSTVQTLVTKDLYNEGQYLMDMAEDAGATIAINGGVFTGLSTSTENIHFQEIAYGGNGGTPQGITISKGEIITDDSYYGAGGIIGFTEDNILVLGKMTIEKTQKLGIRDAVTCGPYLIINGETSTVVGNGGWGTAPRTAIGQRQDGIVLMLCIDGRRATMPGATMSDLIDIMQRYGAYNASALDGGTSTAMVENGKLINDPIDSTGAHATRPIATGFGAVFKNKDVKKDR